ncbi:Histidine kinase-like ATPase domain-containing protein [Paucidesulfovibrio gracilis DSM 16080]|uniref:Histidine kinase-like ATPase domain-containing protein n=1 Tax=Paucidesulfovibrio gracilis DSM 16080 TaxID=1121449 RepID=A0A1T4XYV8_9BACT|nr:Histidine kinase-like ATPase domain-containing protein [Paucidesulfovibrio gracilis DSM 16080]
MTLAITARHWYASLDQRARLGADVVKHQAWNTTVPNRMDELASLSREAEGFMASCGLPERTRFTAHMVIEELVTNCIKYSFPQGEEHLIRLSLQVEPAALRLIIADDGNPFDPRTAPASCLDCSLCDAPVGGLGLSMVRSVARDFRYCRRNGQNHIELVLDLTPTPPVPDAASRS